MHKDSPFLHILTNTCFVFFFLVIAILMCARLGTQKVTLIVVLICVSLMISDVGQLFVCLLAICVSSWEKFLSWPIF